jgi:uncharacterized protein YydD (DUF2326 family)
MLKIVRLYTEPEIISPIHFYEGLNIILGEKDETSDKRNGVGKSLCIEFINFSFFKKRSDSRVSQIPKDIFPENTLICLDFELHGKPLTVKRSISNAETPTILEGDIKTSFEKIEDANRFLTEKLFSHISAHYPTFRIMLGPLIRDERSEFKSIISCYDTKLRIADNYSPHLYLLGIDIAIYEQIKAHIQVIDDIQKDISRIKENVLLIRQKDIDDARSDLNELDSEVKAIEQSIDQLENIKGYEVVREELIKLEEEISIRRTQKGIFKEQLSKLKPVSQKVDIDPIEISDFYNSLKEGLGDLVQKSLEEAMYFKEKIDEFQNKLINDRRKSISQEVTLLDKQLEALDRSYSKSLSVLNQTGELKNLKQTYAAYKDKTDQLSQLRSFVERYDQLEIDKQKAKTAKETDLLRLQSLIQEQKKTIDEFEKTILKIHEYIQGNRQASFQIKPTNNKQVVDITMRIADDGSHSVEREKVFIYDLSLLTNDYTKVRHPGFLIHDNIFDVDQDTLVKSLSFLRERANLDGSQYILTLNSDRLTTSDIQSLEPYIRARFTKQNRFLKKKYQESKGAS